MFTGTYEHAADAKGRIAVPAKWRPQFDGRAILSKGLDGDCLFLWRPEDWEAFVERELDRSSTLSSLGRALNRHLRGYADDVEIDAQGRVHVRPTLRAHAGITRRAILIGVGDRAEIWAPDRWAAFQERDESKATIAEIADRLWKERGV